eukprot:gene300-927_t
MDRTNPVDLDDWDDILCAEPEKSFYKKSNEMAFKDEDDEWNDVIAIEVDEGHCGQIMKQMELFRKQSILCDAKIIVDDKELFVHKNVLAAASIFFHDIFSRIKNQDENAIRLNNINGKTMDDILHFIYTGEAYIHDDNVRQLIATANFLSLNGLKDMSITYLEKKLVPSNSVEILGLASKHNCVHLKEMCEKMICDNFAMVSKTEGFKKCSLDILIFFMENEDLKVLKEEEVYESMFNWIKYDVYEREKHLPNLLQHVRLPLISPFYLSEVVEKEVLLQRNQECLDLIVEAKKYSMQPVDRSQYGSKQMRPRKFMGVVWSIVSVGGWQQNMPTKDVYAYVPSKEQWYPLLPMLECRYNHAVTSCDGFIYVIGGRNEKTKLMSSVLRFDPSANSWSYVSSLPYAMTAIGAVTFDGQMYAIGGLSIIGSVNLVYKYSARKDSWQQVAPLSMPRSGIATASDEKNIYAIGGIHKATGDGRQSTWTYLDSMEIYNKEFNSWEFATSLPSPRAYASAVHLNGRIFLIGGQSEMLGICKGFDAYNISTKEWISFPYMGIPRSMTGIALSETKFYVVGGITRSGDSVNTVETYDQTKDRWTKITSLPLSVGANQCSTIQLRLAVLQGLITSISE